MALNFFNSIVIVFKCFQNKSNRYSNCHDPLHRCIIIIVSNQSTTNLPKLISLPKFKFQSKSFSKISSARRFLRLLKIMAPVLNIDFVHAVLEAINYLVF